MIPNPKEPAKRGRGRPPVTEGLKDKEEVIKQCAYFGEARKECIDFLRLNGFKGSEDTFERWVKKTWQCSYTELMSRLAVNRRNKLKSLAHHMAATAPSILIFLLKNECGYTDKNDLKSTDIEFTPVNIKQLKETFKDVIKNDAFIDSVMEKGGSKDEVSMGTTLDVAPTPVKDFFNSDAMVDTTISKPYSE